MREFFMCFLSGAMIVLAFWIHEYNKPTELEAKCLVPFTRGNIVADPTIRTCYDVKQGVKTILDCKTLVTMEPFKAVKGCFQ